MRRNCNIRLGMAGLSNWLVIIIGLALVQPALSQSTADDIPVILTIGESTTAGYGVSASKSYPAQLQDLLADDGYSYRVVNHGRNGMPSSSALSDVHRGMLLQPAVVIIALGGNDSKHPAAVNRTRRDLGKLVSLFTVMDAAVYLAERDGSIYRQTDSSKSIFAEITEEHGAILMTPLLAGVENHPDMLLGDGHHPNAEGYAIVAQQIFDTIEPSLERHAEHKP